MVPPGLVSRHRAILMIRDGGMCLRTLPGDVFVTSGQWVNGRHGLNSAQKR